MVPPILHLGSRWWSQLYAPATFPPGTHWTGGWVWTFCVRGKSVLFLWGVVKPVFIDKCPVSCDLCVNAVTLKCHRIKTHAIHYSVLELKSDYICKIVRHLCGTPCLVHIEARGYRHGWTQSCQNLIVIYHITSNLRLSFLHFFFGGGELKIRALLKFEVLFVTFRKPRTLNFRRKTVGFTKIVVTFTDGEMCLLARIVDILNSLINSFPTYLLLLYNYNANYWAF